MKTVIALHGNPGSPEDWNLLREKMDSNYHLIAASSYDSNWLELIQHGQDKKILVGHSWGCYQILKNIRSIESQVEKIILCAPYCIFERKISALTQLLLKTPGLGDFLIKKNHQKSKDQFLKDLLHPLGLNEMPYFNKIKDRMDDWQIWKKTAEAKIQSQSFEISNADASGVHGYIIFGDKDAISNNKLQSRILEFFPELKEIHIPEAGHELIWSQVDKIVELIK